MSESSQKKRRSRTRNPAHERPEGAYTVVVRNQALALVYRRLSLAALLAVLAAIVSVIVLVAVAGKPVPPQYIPVSSDGRLLPLIPLNKPNVDDGVVGEFALRTIRELNNYDYISWRTQVLRAQDRFLPASWKTYMTEFEATNIIRTVEARKMIVVGQPSGNIEFQNRGLSDDGIYTWRVAVPVSIQYISHAENTGGAANIPLASEGVATLYIQRVPPTLSSTGLAVRAYQYEQKGSR